MRMKMAPSLMSANLLELGNEVRSLEPYADCLHIDIIDWHYVKNMCLTPQIMKAVRSITSTPIEAHLYMDNIDEQLIETCLDAGATVVTMPADVIGRSIHRFADLIHKADAQIGIFLNPSQRIEDIRSYATDVDELLLLAADPGFGGQSFIDGTYKRIEDACRLRNEVDGSFIIEVDGNCEESKFSALAKAGADMLALGRGCFGRSGNTAEAARLTLESLVKIDLECA